MFMVKFKFGLFGLHFFSVLYMAKNQSEKRKLWGRKNVSGSLENYGKHTLQNINVVVAKTCKDVR